MTTRSGAIKGMPYTHKTRFQNEEGIDGTNPEELIAAAHAACFNMALSFMINGAGHTAEELSTEAVLVMDQQGFDYTIAKITLKLDAKVPGIDNDELEKLANAAKESCPVSQALASVDIALEVNVH